MEPTLSATTPEELGAILDGKSDATIAAEVAEFGTDQVLDQVFSAMAARFLPARARGERATIEWNIETSEGMRSHHLHIENGTCTWRRGAAPGPVRVRFTAPVPIFLRVASGRLNGLQAFSRGQLRVSGEEVLALSQQLWFDVGASHAELDISTPSELRRLIAGRSDAELEVGVVVTGVDRALDQVFAGMVDHYVPDKGPRKRTVVEFSVRTSEGDRVYQFVAQREGASFHRGSRETANVTLGMHCASFLRVVAGDPRAVGALVQGKIKFRGQLLTALSVRSWFDVNR